MRNIKLSTLILTFALAISCITGCGTASKVIKQIELGGENMTAGNYVAAIDAYSAAISLDQYSVEGYTGLIQAMNGNGSSQEEINAKIQEGMNAIAAANNENKLSEKQEAVENFYLAASELQTGKEAINTLKTGLDIVSTENSILQEKFETEVKDLTNSLLENKKFDEAKDIVDSFIGAEAEDEELKNLYDKTTEQQEEESQYVETLLKAKDLIEAKNWQGLADLYDSEAVKALNEKIGDVGNYIYMLDNGANNIGIGMYSMEGCDCNQWYYGTIIDGSREGEGGWYWAKNKDNGLFVENYEGNWSNDMPNGNGYDYKYINGIECGYGNVNVVNGLYDGVYEEKFKCKDGKIRTCPVTINKGVPQLPSNLPDYFEAEEGWQVIAFVEYVNSNGKEERMAMINPEGSLCGIFHFRD